jgi:Uma2 family endonuclease
MSSAETIPPAVTSEGPISPEGDVLYEVSAGQRVELPPTGAYECWLATRLAALMQPYCQSNNLGRTMVETLFVLDAHGDLQRRPDVAFVSFERWPKNRRVPRTSAWSVVPNLAVEVISVSNSADEVMAKIREYFAAGCEQVWVIYPTEEWIYVYRSATETRILTKADVLSGDSMLPGFKVAVRELFEEA